MENASNHAPRPSRGNLRQVMSLFTQALMYHKTHCLAKIKFISPDARENMLAD